MEKIRLEISSKQQSVAQDESNKISLEALPPTKRILLDSFFSWTDPPPTHTYTIESKDTKTCTLECKENGQIWKIPHHKNVNKSKNHCSPVKLENKKKNDKKVLASRDGSGGAIQSTAQEKPRPV